MFFCLSIKNITNPAVVTFNADSWLINGNQNISFSEGPLNLIINDQGPVPFTFNSTVKGSRLLSKPVTVDLSGITTSKSLVFDIDTVYFNSQDGVIKIMGPENPITIEVDLFTNADPRKLPNVQFVSVQLIQPYQVFLGDGTASVIGSNIDIHGDTDYKVRNAANLDLNNLIIFDESAIITFKKDPYSTVSDTDPLNLHLDRVLTTKNVTAKITTPDVMDFNDLTLSPGSKLELLPGSMDLMDFNYISYIWEGPREIGYLSLNKMKFEAFPITTINSSYYHESETFDWEAFNAAFGSQPLPILYINKNSYTDPTTNTKFVSDVVGLNSGDECILILRKTSAEEYSIEMKSPLNATTARKVGTPPPSIPTPSTPTPSTPTPSTPTPSTPTPSTPTPSTPTPSTPTPSTPTPSTPTPSTPTPETSTTNMPTPDSSTPDDVKVPTGYSDSNSKRMSSGAVAGIAIFVTVVIVGAAAVAIVFVLRKKKAAVYSQSGLEAELNASGTDNVDDSMIFRYPKI